MVSITPRSFTSGAYFQTFRSQFFREVALTRIHIFESRRDAFSRDKVLQENVILHTIKETVETNSRNSVRITSSNGIEDLESSAVLDVPLSSVLEIGEKESVFTKGVKKLMVFRKVMPFSKNMPL